MITLNRIIDFIDQQFLTNKLEAYVDESGITYDSGKLISKIGFATNITLEVVEKAKEQGVDLIITHHDAWDFIYGLKEKLIDKLKAYHISHYFTHLPLDDSSFGTNSSLLKKLGLKEISRHAYFDGFSCGALGIYNPPILFKDLVNRFEDITDEPSLSWDFGNQWVEKVYVVCGGGAETDLVKEAIHLKADVYISGEKVLYTIQYANLQQINLLIGSHTFTEIFGLESLVKLIDDQFDTISVERIHEEHIETKPFRLKVKKN